MTATTRTTRPITLAGSFSFYLSPADPALVKTCGALADAVVLKGRRGPRTVTTMRRAGWTGTVLFDCAAYEARCGPVDHAAWFDAQARAGADRLMTPGRWVGWDPRGDAIRRGVDAEWRIAQTCPGSTLVLALDSRWLTKSSTVTVDALRQPDHHVAVILAHRDDPLGVRGAVSGLLELTYSIRELTFLRSDHGAIGAVAHGAAHGSIGLRSVYRHFVPPEATSSFVPGDRTPRVFVEDLMDWYRGSIIAGWGVSNVSLDCPRSCCGGARLTRFAIDPRLEAEADRHNRTVPASTAG